MGVRFYVDPGSGRPHIDGHGVTENEVVEALANAAEDRPASDGARISIGRTSAGRLLRVIYVPDPDGEGIFVVTSYELTGKPLAAFMRRMRKSR